MPRLAPIRQRAASWAGVLRTGCLLFRGFREGLIVVPWIMFAGVIKHLLEN